VAEEGRPSRGGHIKKIDDIGGGHWGGNASSPKPE
jgi:hypothetical protein